LYSYASELIVESLKEYFEANETDVEEGVVDVVAKVVYWDSLKT
jgi:hypothetical protein